MKKVLIIAYMFPPTGGVGSIRVAKQVKYLGEFGWEPVVLTVKSPSSPLSDQSLADDLPPGLRVRKAPSFEPAPPPDKSAKASGPGGPGLMSRIKPILQGLLFPDRHIIWLPSALPAAISFARRERVDAVMVTAPPFSTTILGALTASAVRKPLLLDFRDVWSGFFAKGFDPGAGGVLWRRMIFFLERLMLKRADAVIGNTSRNKKRLLRLHGGPPGKYHFIPNGFDPQDFVNPDQPNPSAAGKLELLYTGMIFGPHNLGPLWEAAGFLDESQRKRIRVTIVGRVLPGQTADPMLPGLKVRVLPHEPHAKVLERMARAGALVVAAQDLPGQELMVPAKLYEYLAAKKPVLGILPAGEAADIIRLFKAGVVVSPNDPLKLAGILSDWIAKPPAPGGQPPNIFNRRLQAGLLAQVLNEISR